MQPTHPIGIIGAGGIVKAAHLPAYRAAGFAVSAIYDKEVARAASLATEFGIPKVCHSLDELLEDSTVEVIDIAVPPDSQLEIAPKVIGCGKHLLCQKPLARTAAGAEILVKAAESVGVKLAVNVSMRWSPAMRETAELIRSGAIGDVRSVLFDVKYYEYWQSWPWLVPSDRLLILFDMIHILDVTRTIMGEARSVLARFGRAKDSDVAGETWADIRIEYGSNAVARFDEDSRIPPDRTCVRFHFTGSRGAISGTLGIYYDYPFGRADTLRVVPAGQVEETVAERQLPGRWVPDAFSETMRALFVAMDTDSLPQNSGRDHLKTLRLIDSIYTAGEMEMLPHRSAR